ncbi:hypothetical protein VD659_06975 [Herbiconiux sp. 11R-BC]|uniref:hypothetical protein n=1 Tax=Herbiconiux sp. 11R-BC TaxID=3111637 RepID=UPI003C053376
MTEPGSTTESLGAAPGASPWGAPEPEPLRWAAESWALELRGDELAEIRFEGSLVLRSVRAVVRDRDWQTVPMAVRSVEAREGELIVGLAAVGLGARIVGSLTVSAHADGLRVAYAAQSQTAFLRNRVGLVVLHPPSVAGEVLEVTAPDGAESRIRFPRALAPHQPARNIAGLRWTSDGVRSELFFAGDVFEMEDQRNWTDASFKSYSTPLELPFPVLLEVGDRVAQSVSLRCVRVAEPARSPGARPRLVAAGHRAPRLGVGASTAPDAVLTVGAPVAIGGAGNSAQPVADFLLVELECATPTWRAALGRAVAEARGRPLDVRIVAPEAAVGEPGGAGRSGDGIDEVLAALRGLEVERVGVYDTVGSVTRPAQWRALTAGIAAMGIGTRRDAVTAPAEGPAANGMHTRGGSALAPAEAVGGARSHFTELNRVRPAEPTAVTFSITPQMHAVEAAQLVESIAMQRLVAADAVRIAGARPVHVGPVTLRSRYNAVATTAAPSSPHADLRDGYGAALVPSATDPRQSSPALAAWTVASYVALAVDGVHSVTYFETDGPRGLGSEGTRWPVATAMEWLHEISGRPLLAADGLPDGVWLLAAEVDGGLTVLAANLATGPARVDVALPDGATLSLDIPPLAAVRHRV